MRKPVKITKSEIILLAATAVFVALALVIHFTAERGRTQDGYTVRTWRAEEQPEERLPGIDINTADEETLQQLPGIGPALAERIVADRAANGPFDSVDELTRVPGIGEITVEELRPYVTAGSPGEEAERENTGG